MHERVVAHYKGGKRPWEEVDWSRVDDYGLLHLAKHLYELRNDEAFRSELYKLICKSFMSEKKARTFSHRAFGEDVNLAIDVTTEDESSEGLAQLVRNCLIYSTLGSRATTVPPEVLEVLAQTGETKEIQKAIDYAELIQAPEKRSEAFRLIGEAILAMKRI